MIPAVLGLTAWIAKGVVLTALPRLLRAVTDRCSPTPKTSPTPPVRLNQAVLEKPARVIVYAYDNLSQLVGVNINQTPAASFQFDLAGNLQSLTVGNTTTAQTFNALNQKTTPGVNVYDAKGQTTDKDGRTFEWDDDGRMTAIVDGTHRSEFSYDGYGRRIKIAEFDNGTLTSKKLYWWLGGQIVCERDGIDPGFPLTKRYFGQGVVVGAERLYYTMDQLGSVRELVDSAGVVRSDYRYTPYGERTKVGGDLESDFGFAGLFHHGPSGLDLATYRTYDSKMGRWISRDPLGEGVDYNLYRYCGNNPISGTDPSGLFQVTGDALDRQTYLEYWQAITGYTLDYDPHGDVRITGQTCVKSQSARQRLRDMIRFGSGMTIQLMTLMSRRGSHGAIVVGSPGILSGGDRFHHAIDMADIRSASMGNQNIGQGNFLHENAEAYDIATSGGTGTYEAGHSEAIDAENQYYQDMGLPYHRPQVQTTSLGPHAGQINYGSLQVDIFNNGPVATFVYH